MLRSDREFLMPNGTSAARPGRYAAHSGCEVLIKCARYAPGEVAWTPDRLQRRDTGAWSGSGMQNSLRRRWSLFSISLNHLLVDTKEKASSLCFSFLTNAKLNDKVRNLIGIHAGESKKILSMLTSVSDNTDKRSPTGAVRALMTSKFRTWNHHLVWRRLSRVAHGPAVDEAELVSATGANAQL